MKRLSLFLLSMIVLLSACGNKPETVQSDLNKLHELSGAAISVTPDSVMGIWQAPKNDDPQSLKYFRVKNTSIDFAYGILGSTDLVEFSVPIRTVTGKQSGYFVVLNAANDRRRVGNYIYILTVPEGSTIPYKVEDLNLTLTIAPAGLLLKKVSDLLE